MLSQTCARRELGSSCERLDIFAGTSDGTLFGGYARLVGAPNCASSLRSVAGLLLALALQSRLRAPPPTSLEMLNARRILLAPPRSGPSVARHRRVCTGERFGRRGIRGCRAKPTAAHFTDLDREARGVLGEAPAARARRLGAPARPNGGRARTLPRRGHPSPTSRDGCLEHAHGGARDLTGACRAIG
jgi:hypothetical protein